MRRGQAPACVRIGCVWQGLYFSLHKNKIEAKKICAGGDSLQEKCLSYDLENRGQFSPAPCCTDSNQ